LAANVIIRQPRLDADLEALVRHGVEIVISSVGSPESVIAPLHDAGALVLADVATLRHAEAALSAGADGLVLLAAGAGGQTGHLNPFAFTRAVRGFFDGPLVLAGGMCDGYALHSARTLGCDLGYVGTPFIATTESLASAEYKRMLVDCSMDDVMLTRAFTGLPVNMLVPSIVAAGLDPRTLDERVSAAQSAELYAGGEGVARWVDIRSAGHSVSAIRQIEGAADLVFRLMSEYHDAQSRLGGPCARVTD
jgi:nitronate monooxygenase